MWRIGESARCATVAAQPPAASPFMSSTSYIGERNPVMAKRRDRVVAAYSMGSGGSTAVSGIPPRGGVPQLLSVLHPSPVTSVQSKTGLEAMTAVVFERCSFGLRRARTTPGLITWSVFSILASFKETPSALACCRSRSRIRVRVVQMSGELSSHTRGRLMV
jgi:hypothetical protein